MSIIKSSITRSSDHQQARAGRGAAGVPRRADTPADDRVRRRRLARRAVAFDHMVVAPSGICRSRPTARVRAGRSATTWATGARSTSGWSSPAASRTDLIDTMERRRHASNRYGAVRLQRRHSSGHRARVQPRRARGSSPSRSRSTASRCCGHVRSRSRLSAPGPMTAIDIDVIAHQLADRLHQRRCARSRADGDGLTEPEHVVRASRLRLRDRGTRRRRHADPRPIELGPARAIPAPVGPAGVQARSTVSHPFGRVTHG